MRGFFALDLGSMPRDLFVVATFIGMVVAIVCASLCHGSRARQRGIGLTTAEDVGADSAFHSQVFMATLMAGVFVLSIELVRKQRTAGEVTWIAGAIAIIILAASFTMLRATLAREKWLRR